MSNGHAKHAPSSAALRVACAGSLALELANPEKEPERPTLEGDAAHWVAAEILYGRTIDTGLIAPNDIMLTDEMVEGADMYVEELRRIMADFPGCVPHVEEYVDISWIHPECGGTPDFWVYRPPIVDMSQLVVTQRGRLTIRDYKFGHRYVDEFENWQLIEYVAGILVAVGVDGISDEYVDVDMGIIQPRCFSGGSPIRNWVTTARALRGAFNVLQAAEYAASQPGALCTPNPGCRDCRGRSLCKAIQVAAYAGMDTAYTAVPFDLPPDALGVELRFVDKAIEALTARRTGLEEQALKHLKLGKGIPFYSLQQSMGRERWARPDEEIISFGALMGKQLTKAKLVTPKQAISLGLDAELVRGFSEVPKGETKLKPDDGSAARKVFSS